MKENYKITYTLEYDKQKKLWIVFKMVESEHTLGFGSIFNGTKKDCLEYIEKNNIKIKQGVN